MTENFGREYFDKLAERLETAFKSECGSIRSDLRDYRQEARLDHVRLRDDLTEHVVETGGKLILHAAQIAALERDVAGVRAAAVRIAVLIGGLAAAAVTALFKKVFG